MNDGTIHDTNLSLSLFHFSDRPKLPYRTEAVEEAQFCTFYVRNKELVGAIESMANRKPYYED